MPVVPRRTLGRTGAEVSILGLGLGSAYWRTFDNRPDEAEEILLRAFSYGINYFDTSRNYGNSELLAAPAVERIRDGIFLVSKSGSRDYDGYRADLETSLENLRTDHLDLYHIHNLNPNTDADLDLIENGAVRAAREAKEQGLIRNIGITGHSGTGILMEAIRRWDPDVILTTYPADRPEDGAYEDKLLPLALERNMGVVAMKAIRRARDTDWPALQLIRYPMSLPGIATTIVGLDSIAHLDENAAMASAFEPMDAAEMAEMSRLIRSELAGLGPAPWDRPGYRDGQPGSWTLA
ncbi:MAG: aldo/keto reductase [Xanthomonadales bacterium]|nr:aldo/keto reductase [Xanthomonadales bacterium]NIX12068.1 aldo/keto reductase [Xanthomonadales bacterium]